MDEDAYKDLVTSLQGVENDAKGSRAKKKKELEDRRANGTKISDIQFEELLDLEVKVETAVKRISVMAIRHSISFKGCYAKYVNR